MLGEYVTLYDTHQDTNDAYAVPNSKTNKADPGKEQMYARANQSSGSRIQTKNGRSPQNDTQTMSSDNILSNTNSQSFVSNSLNQAYPYQGLPQQGNLLQSNTFPQTGYQPVIYVPVYVTPQTNGNVNLQMTGIQAGQQIYSGQSYSGQMYPAQMGMQPMNGQVAYNSQPVQSYIQTAQGPVYGNQMYTQGGMAGGQVGYVPQQVGAVQGFPFGQQTVGVGFNQVPTLVY